MQKTIITNNYTETQNFGKKIASSLKNGAILALYGDLGSGKTTFTQGFAKGLKIEKKIISPTFIIIRSYALKNKTFYHVDLYRIKDKIDIEDLGLPEILTYPGNIIVIEWPEKIQNSLPRNRINIYFKYLDNNKRKITINETNY